MVLHTGDADVVNSHLALWKNIRPTEGKWNPKFLKNQIEKNHESVQWGDTEPSNQRPTGVKERELGNLTLGRWAFETQMLYESNR